MESVMPDNNDDLVQKQLHRLASAQEAQDKRAADHRASEEARATRVAAMYEWSAHWQDWPEVASRYSKGITNSASELVSFLKRACDLLRVASPETAAQIEAAELSLTSEANRAAELSPIFENQRVIRLFMREVLREREQTLIDTLESMEPRPHLRDAGERASSLLSAYEVHGTIDIPVATPEPTERDAQQGYSDRREEDRDKWIYEKRKANWKNQEILDELERIAAQKGWRPLTSAAALRDAEYRYVRRTSAESLPPNRGGRPRKKNR